MCGILAISSPKDTLAYTTVAKMLNSISHRGKDFAGIEHISKHNVWIAHARLSLIDLSSRANQPMTNEDGNLYLSFNGEIYNFRELRSDLIQLGHTFKSHSDAEVILHGYEAWGVSLLERLNGMFAFVIYNAQNNEFFCARDRFGIKPLYYAIFKNNLIVSSEIKPILQFPGFTPKINYTSICEYLTYRYIPSPHTIYQDIYKLPPAHYFIYRNNRIEQAIEYWQLQFNESLNTGNLLQEIEYRIEETVKKHLISDVPVGIFLSGGIDSSVVAMMSKRLGYHAQAFNIGFTNWNKSEHIAAQQIAQSLGLDIKTKILEPATIDNISESVYFYDEPIADISIVPTFEISRWASQHVHTVLSGEGGDELFAGYTWHQQLMKQLWLLKWKKDSLVNFYAQSMAMGLFDKKELKQIIHPSLHNHIPDDEFHFYRKHLIQHIHPLKAIQYLDLKTFLAELVLTKVDRSSMAHTLEVRVPLLDHQLVEFMFSLSPKMYFSFKQSKFLLRKLLANKIPRHILHAPKQGFVGPDHFYQQNEWYKKYLSDSQLVKHQIFSKNTINHYFNTNQYWKLWKILILENWFRKWMIL